MGFHDMEDEHSTPGYADPTPPRERRERDPDEEREFELDMETMWGDPEETNENPA